MPIEKWKIVNQKVIFEHPRLTLIEDDVILPDGAASTYLRFKQTGHVATIIVLGDDGRVLLQREYSHPPQEVLYQFPGGSVPNGEDPVVGANRELMEECGLRGDLELIGEHYCDHRRSNAKAFVFVATHVSAATLPQDDEEFLEHEWRSVKEVDALLREGEIKNAYMLVAWAFFKDYVQCNSQDIHKILR